MDLPAYCIITPLVCAPRHVRLSPFEATARFPGMREADLKVRGSATCILVASGNYVYTTYLFGSSVTMLGFGEAVGIWTAAISERT